MKEIWNHDGKGELNLETMLIIWTMVDACFRRIWLRRFRANFLSFSASAAPMMAKKVRAMTGNMIMVASLAYHAVHSCPSCE